MFHPMTYCSHCYHLESGPIWMVVPCSHVLIRCCKCNHMVTMHQDHYHELPCAGPIIWTQPIVVHPPQRPWFDHPRQVPKRTTVRDGKWFG